MSRKLQHKATRTKLGSVWAVLPSNLSCAPALQTRCSLVPSRQATTLLGSPPLATQSTSVVHGRTRALASSVARSMAVARPQAGAHRMHFPRSNPLVSPLYQAAAHRLWALTLHCSGQDGVAAGAALLGTSKSIRMQSVGRVVLVLVCTWIAAVPTVMACAWSKAL